MQHLQSNGHVSFSRLALKSRCGEKYRRRYILGAKDSDNLPSVAGSAVHSAVEQAEREGQLDSLLEIAKANLRAVDGLKELQYWGKQNVAWWFRKGLADRCRNYLTWRERAQPRWYLDDPALSSEVGILVQFVGSPGLPIIPPLLCYLDQVFYDANGRLVIDDLKTGKKKSDHLMQLQFYMLAWNVLHPEEPASYGQLLYLNGSKPTVDTTMLTLTVDDAVRMLSSLLDERGFPFNGPFTGECNICQFVGDCPAGQVGKVKNVLY